MDSPFRNALTQKFTLKTRAATSTEQTPSLGVREILHFSWEMEVLAFFLCSPREGPGKALTYSEIQSPRAGQNKGVRDDGHC